MASINYTAPDGTEHNIPLPEGADPATVVADFEAARGFDAPLSAIAPPPSLDTPDNIPTSIEEANRLRGRATPLIGENRPATTQERVERGLALSARPVVSAIPKVGTGVADLLGMGGNTLGQLIENIDAQLSEREPGAVDAFPTGSTASLDELLNEIFPEPQGMAERIAQGTGEVALSGGAGGAALTGRATPALATPSAQSLGANVLDEIGQFFAANPRLAAALEISGGAGAVTGGELAEEAELGPTGTILATLGGGVVGGATPAAATTVGRRAVQSVAENVLPSTARGSEVRAARRLQDEAGDVSEAVTAVREGPEGVLPARATEDANLQALERRVLEDDPKLERRATQELEQAEETSLRELADQFGPTSDKVEWQRQVIQESAPEGVTVNQGQPDEMLRQVNRSFSQAYGDSAGFPIKLQTVEVVGGDVPLREAVKQAIDEADALASPEIQKRALDRVDSRIDKLEERQGFGGFEDAVDSKDILELRSAIRSKQRQLARNTQNSDAQEEAELLKAANGALTEVLETQLPDAARAALQATDSQYKKFVTVEEATFRSREKGLTPEALRAAVAARTPSRAQVARGETGELGVLAETGRDVSKVLGKPEEAARLVRNMTPEQKQTAKADFNEAISQKSTRLINGESRLDGKKYLDNINQNRETLEAAGFTAVEISNMQKVGRELRMIQARSPKAVETLLNDNVGSALRLVAAIAGSRAGTRLLRLTGGAAAGPGPNLIVAQFGSKTLRDRFKSLSVDRADQLLRAALSGETREVDGKTVTLMEALLTKPTASLPKQTQAARTIDAFLLEPARQVSENENE